MKVLVISGGSSGIGLGCVEKFLNNGYIVYNLDINPITMNHANYFYIKTDVCNPENILKSVDEIKTKSEKVDCLITSAGKHLSANIENTTNDDLNSIINLNILGTFWLIKSIIPIMKKQGNGSIITIGSDQSIIVKNNSTAYGLSKAATASLTKSVALDYAQYNIRANCIAAGTIDTPLFRAAIEKYSKKSGISIDEIQKQEAASQPLNKIGTKEDIANLAYFLASEEAKFITGSLISIDGGYTIK